MATAATDVTNIILGSGKLYLGQISNVETATEAEIDAALVEVGSISGGASLEYSPDVYEVESANYGTLARWLTREEITFKSGILTWNIENLSKLNPAFFSYDIANNTKRVGIGGNSNLPVNYLRFVHEKPTGKTLTVNIFKAQNLSGFSITFDKGKETVLDAEFKALSVPSKTDGNLVEIIEQLDAVAVPTVSTISISSITTAELPEVIVVTGINYASNSEVYVDNGITTTDLRTLFDSATQLTAILPDTLIVGTYNVKVKTGTTESTTSQTLTIS